MMNKFRMTEDKNKQEGINENRRKFLTVMLIGSGAFLVEKVLAPLFSKVSSQSSPVKTGSSNRAVFKNFWITENKKGLSVHDSSGEEIFQIDKDMS